MPFDFAAAICESEAPPVGALEVFFIELPAEAEPEAEVAGVVGALAAEFDMGAAALALAAEDLLVLAGVFALSAEAADPESITLEFSVLLFLLLLVPVVLALAGSLEASPEDAALVSDFLPFLLLFVPVVLALAGSLEASPEDAALVSDFLPFLLLFVSAVLALAGPLEASPEDAALVSDFLLFLLVLFEELLLAISELAELSEAAESDFFDFELFFDEVESPEELVLLVALSELDFFFDFLLLVEDVSADVPDWESCDWAKATGTDNMNNRHIPAAQAVSFREKRFINIEPTFRSASLNQAEKGRSPSTMT
jgi:hypothetical protein